MSVSVPTIHRQQRSPLSAAIDINGSLMSGSNVLLGVQCYPRPMDRSETMCSGSVRPPYVGSFGKKTGGGPAVVSVISALHFLAGWLPMARELARKWEKSDENSATRHHYDMLLTSGSVSTYGGYGDTRVVDACSREIRLSMYHHRGGSVCPYRDGYRENVPPLSPYEYASLRYLPNAGEYASQRQKDSGYRRSWKI